MNSSQISEITEQLQPHRDYPSRVNFRNRNVVSAIRKKVEVFEFIKRDMLREGAEFTQEKYDAARKSIHSLQCDISLMNQEVEDLKATHLGGIHPYITNVQDSIDKIIKLRNGESTIITSSLDRDYLHITYNTPTVYLRHNGKNIKIGRMKVKFAIEMRINSRNYTVGISNIDRILFDSYSHPHICGTPCWGSYEPIIINLWRQGKLFDLSNLIDEFLNHYNPVSPFKKIKYWELERSETSYCTCCQELLVDCPNYIEDEEGGDQEEEYEDLPAYPHMVPANQTPVGDGIAETNTFTINRLTANNNLTIGPISGT